MESEWRLKIRSRHTHSLGAEKAPKRPREACQTSPRHTHVATQTTNLGGRKSTKCLSSLGQTNTARYVTGLVYRGERDNTTLQGFCLPWRRLNPLKRHSRDHSQAVIGGRPAKVARRLCLTSSPPHPLNPHATASPAQRCSVYFNREPKHRQDTHMHIHTKILTRTYSQHVHVYIYLL